MSITKEYKEQLRKEHDGSRWGSTGYKYSGGLVQDVVVARPYIRTAFDYGCGKGTLAQAFNNLEWTEYDPGIPGKDVKPSGQFDLVTCTDVLEHVERAKLAGVLEDLHKATGKVLVLDIACYPTGKEFGEGPYKGQDLHITIEHPEWWLEQTLKAFTDLQLFEYRGVKKLSKGKMKDRAVLIYERV